MNLFNTELEFFLLCLSTLFPLVNPLGITPIFLSMTEGYNHTDKISIAKKGAMTGSITLIVFALFGSVIFTFFGITIEAFQIMGGIIFFRTGLHMLDAKVGRTRTTVQEQKESITASEIAYTPVGIPLITGPGAITGAMLLSGQTQTPYNFGTLIFAIILVMATVLFIFLGGEKITQRFGVTGMRIIQRIMGLILMVIAVQFVINGITVVVSKIL
ncbi:MAG: NAAT family transporter [Candidatus Marinimicrobia bacterium]|jgi:multiple antibiotic resistance protein|nr:NAAT family transporter [Candidatus Neomarinimicrobiota bacterium]MBT3617646.1 NAAT family transporter [Candidatus Neomarinimicrobiota bacterium]MBT3829080.1 NAAT family transporter [Candidatus Neomarinimicrobiota bacterium]MBT3997738.1 NAAT family transporter [Candidatus Neomarinimicrobiota bacterium]MBT4281375.1 NAAT family transporter [Candidatus Neomarinimicrobiota bacterium]